MTEDRTSSVEDLDNTVPSSARWLGGLGVAPFICLAGAAPLLGGSTRTLVAHALVAYGATILSFLGGVHWGLAIGPQRVAHSGKLPGRLIVSVIPSLAGWTALLVAESTGLLVLAAAVAAMLWVDLRATRLGQAPPWYPKLRRPLTFAVVAALLSGAMALITPA